MSRNLAARPSAPQRPRDAPLRVHGTIARELGLAIVAGRLRPGQVLDGEIEASSQRRVSRTAYREAIRILSAKGLISSRPRTGTRVSSISEWHLLDPDVLSWMFSGTPRPEVIHGLFELRTIVEPAAAALAASRRTSAHLHDMRQALEAMARHTLNRPEGRDADRAFHAALLAGTANPFVISLTNGVTAAVDSLTLFKQRLAKIVRDPVPDHVRVYDAIAAKDAEGARDAMSRLIRLAIADMPVRQRPRRPTGTKVTELAYFMPALAKV
jgi:DNA-binding FadR family transcriptional regulator